MNCTLTGRALMRHLWPIWWFHHILGEGLVIIKGMKKKILPKNIREPCSSSPNYFHLVGTLTFGKTVKISFLALAPQILI